MALITCPECGRENVSSTASACPGCGFDIKTWCEQLPVKYGSEEPEGYESGKQELQPVESYETTVDRIPEKKLDNNTKAFLIIGIIGLALIVFGKGFGVVMAAAGFGLYWYMSRSNRQSSANVEETPETNQPQRETPGTEWSQSSDRMEKPKTVQPQAPVRMEAPTSVSNRACCPICGSFDIDHQVFQENTGSKTITTTKSKYKEKGHGCLWWLIIGWWWWIVDLILWIVAFVPRLILRLFSSAYRRKKYSGGSVSITKTVNSIAYRTINICRNCGHTW